VLTKLIKLFRILKNSSYRKALLRGAAAGLEHEKILKSIECSTIIDIGANKGQFAIAARKCFPKARIISFEPLSHPAGIFEKVFSDDRNTSLYRFAISDVSGETDIHLSRREDSSSLLPIGDKQNEIFPGTYETGTEKISAKRLSEVLTTSDLAAPVLLKIDVQGFEYKVLKGCEELLESVKFIYSECSYIELYKGQVLFPEISEFLLSKGFHLVNEFNTTYSSEGKPIQSDFLFVNKHSLTP
jgi:FkbM family methyltransferase